MTERRSPQDQPRPKGDKRERTRRALLKAAGDLIREVGYEGATLEAIAARAGMTRGAIYGNFANRDGLFAAVALDRWGPVTPPFAPGASFAEHMRELGRCYYRTAQARAASAVHAAAFQLQTRKYPELRERIAAQGRETVRRLARQLLEIYPVRDLPMAPEPLIRALGALGEGLMAEYFINPETYDEDLFVSAFEVFGRSRQRPGG